MARPMTTTNVQILIAGDKEAARESTRKVVERQLGWEVCGIATSGREAVDLAVKLEPDVVVMELRMPEFNGLDATRQIKRHRPRTEILIFAADQTDDLIREAFEAGAKSFICKTDGHIQLINAIRSLARHKPFFTDNVSEILFADIQNRSSAKSGPQPSKHLTFRERQIVQMIAGGKSNKEVARFLGISVRTAETHRAAVMRKLNLSSVAGLVRYAIRNHIIEP